MHKAKLIRSIALLITILLMPPAILAASKGAAVPAQAAVKDIKVSFRLDDHTTRAIYMGERWVSPSAYNGVQTGKTFRVKARAEGVDTMGRLTDISPTWTPQDPEMVSVSSVKGHQVEITVGCSATSTVMDVAYGGLTRKLPIKAACQDNSITVQIGDAGK